jgi:hypothetical protein
VCGLLAWKLIHRSGEEYLADFHELEPSDLPKLKKSLGWTRGFDWKKYLADENPFIAYKLVVRGNTAIQGLVALAVLDGYVELDLVEKAPQNRGFRKEFLNAGDVLFGFAGKVSLDTGNDGFVLLYAKTRLVEHYIRKYGMDLIDPRRRKMVINPIAANRIIGLYYT